MHGGVQGCCMFVFRFLLNDDQLTSPSYIGAALFGTLTSESQCAIDLAQDTTKVPVSSTVILFGRTWELWQFNRWVLAIGILQMMGALVSLWSIPSITADC